MNAQEIEEPVALEPNPRLPFLIGHRTYPGGTMAARVVDYFGVEMWACEHAHTDYRELLRCGDDERMRIARDVPEMVPVRRTLFVNASDDKYPDGRTGSAFVRRLEDDAIDEGLGL